MERAGLVAPGTMVVADNVQVPGAPDFLDYITSAAAGGGGGGVAVTNAAGGSSSSTPGTAGLAYRTELVESMFEVEQPYKRDWAPKMDALSVSMCVPAPAAG